MAVHFAVMLYTANADVSPFLFGILDVCDVEHLHAAVAPRPLLVRANLPDNWWPLSGLDDIESLTRKVYRLYGVEDKVDIRAEVHEHDLTGPVRRRARSVSAEIRVTTVVTKAESGIILIAKAIPIGIRMRSSR